MTGENMDRRAIEGAPKPEGLTRDDIGHLLHDAGVQVLRERDLPTQGRGVRIPGFIARKTVPTIIEQVGHTTLTHKLTGTGGHKQKEYVGESLDVLIDKSIDRLCAEKKPSLYSFPPDQVEGIKAAWKDRALTLKKERIA